MSDFYFLFSIIVLVLSVILIVAQLKLFSIDKTLKTILTQAESDRRASDYNMEMLLFELRGDKKSAQDLEVDRKSSSDAAREEAKRSIKPEVLERLRQKGLLPEE